MDRNSLFLMVFVLMTIVIVVIVQTVVVMNLALTSASVSGAAPAPTAMTGTASVVWQDYIKPNVGAISAVVVALIAGIFAYFHLMRQLQTITRNSFLDMLIGNGTYRNQIDLFLSALILKKFDDLANMVDELQALFYLFVLKPHLREPLKDAVAKKDISRTIELTKQLFTA